MTDRTNGTPSRRAFLGLGLTAGAGLWMHAPAEADAAQPAAASPPAAAALNLKVTEVKVYPLKSGQPLVEVVTDAGISGIGECSPMTNPSVFKELIDKAVTRHVVGRNPFDTEKIWRSAYFSGYKLGPMGIFLEALAGVDMALWDIKGKALGVPCYMLMGGKVRDKVPLYASAMRVHRSPQAEVDHLSKWLDQGYTAVKIHPYEYWAFDQGHDDTLDVVRAFRAKYPKVPIMVDVNNSYSVNRAVEVGRALEDLGVFIFEEPIAAYDYDGYARLCDTLDIAVSAGEQEYTHWQHKDLIERGKIDIIQPDVVKCGGLSELLKIGTIATAFNRPIVCHNTQPTIGTAAHYHFWVSNPMCLYHQEYPAEPHALRDKTPILTEPLPIADGFLTLPDKPGLGIDIDRKVLNSLL